MSASRSESIFSYDIGSVPIIRHTTASPFLSVGCGDNEFAMNKGHFHIQQQLREKLPLCHIHREEGGVFAFRFAPDGEVLVRLRVVDGDDRLDLEFAYVAQGINRVYLRLCSQEDEACFGLGQQMSYLNLKGRNYPLWVSEPGIGRDKASLVTFMADRIAGAGGDYYTVNYPQPTFVSSRKYWIHMDCSSYMEFDFSRAEYTELQAWSVPRSLQIRAGDSFAAMVSDIANTFGRQPELPDWVYNGVVLGVQGGTETALEKVRFAEENGVPVSGVWCQDWEGKRVTSFGKRLQWDWVWNEKEYPGLDHEVARLEERGIRFLGYINPCLVEDGTLFPVAAEKGYLVMHPQGGVYLVDFGEFNCGTVDLTNPQAFAWYKDVIKKNLIDFGQSGWMADFAEYLPTDAVLHSGESAEVLHNQWPRLWAKLNREAIEESGKAGEILFFMRSGFTGFQAHCPLLWAGDQSVDFSRHDGLVSVICAALSAGMSGMGLHHSDIGGYTSFSGQLIRSKELLLRWTEMAAFTPFMRTHEGNRPEENHQFYSDEESARFLAQMTGVYKALTPYIKAAVAENATSGIPVQRPLFLHYDDAALYNVQDQYLLGRDLLVAPVWKEGETARPVLLPQDEWIHLWNGKPYTQGQWEIEAPIGAIPVFYRKNSPYSQLFQAAAAIMKGDNAQ